MCPPASHLRAHQPVPWQAHLGARPGGLWGWVGTQTDTSKSIGYPAACTCHQLVAGCNLDCGNQRAIDRALLGKHAVHALDGLARRFRSREFQVNMDPADNQGSAFIFYFAASVGLYLSTIYFDFARYQRAGKCAKQSTSGGRNDVV